MRMFESFLASIPRSRSQLVNELELPDDIALSPYVWAEPEPLLDDSLTARSTSALSGSAAEYDVTTASTDSSMPLSRALTDSEIDYDRYRRWKGRSLSDPWDHLRAAVDAFPPGYLASLNSFQDSSSSLTEDSAYERVRRYNEELRLKMERFFEEECRAFSPDDPALLAIEDALHTVDMKAIENDLESISP